MENVLATIHFLLLKRRQRNNMNKENKMQRELRCPQAGYTRVHVVLSLILSSCLAIFYTYIHYTLSIGYFISLN